ncbi:alpha/beta fold hydrolase [Zavarzinia sp. CC-PAN008]|uniref:alpha/beta fold hydrolase n=1 Tax=Zavarzinia sp. CC-PAN008 TaxID=3243332 RepID=UPI003F74953C
MTAPIPGVENRITVETARGRFSALTWPAPTPQAPLLHFAHATGFNALTYRRLLARLASRFEVHAIDLRGHGFTQADADPAHLTGWDVYAEDIATYLGRLGRPALLVGHSMGGAASALAAARHRHLASGVLLIEPAALPITRMPPVVLMQKLGLVNRLIQRLPLSRQTLRRRADFPSRDAMMEAYRGRGAFRTWNDDWLRDYIDGGTRDLPDGGVTLACTPAWEARTFAMVSPRVFDAIARIKAPVALLRGQHGTTFGDGSARVARLLRPGLPDTLVSDASHFLPMEQPDLVLDTINRFADRWLHDHGRRAA